MFVSPQHPGTISIWFGVDCGVGRIETAYRVAVIGTRDDGRFLGEGLDTWNGFEALMIGLLIGFLPLSSRFL